jgi:mannose-1-phosphate guanylyltransferase/phosphomannomutase
MQAIIMAGGFGTRLRPITCSVPKPMALMANKSMLCHIVDLLKKYNFLDLTMLLYFHSEIISSCFKQGEEFGVNINYIRPELDLGTAGSVRFASKSIDGTFVVISGDVLTDFDLSKAVEFHKDKKALATMILTRVANPLQFGVVITDEDGKVERFLEKPSWGEVFSDTVNTGIYILEPEVFNYIPQSQSFDFSKDLYPLFLEKGERLYGYVAEGYWRDIGSHDEYRQAHYDILDGKVKIKMGGKKKSIGDAEIIAGDNVTIGKDVQIRGGVLLGDNVTIGDGVVISRSVIGSNCKIGSGAEIIDSVLWEDSSVGVKARIEENVLGTAVEIGDRAVVQAGSVIAEGSKIGENAIVGTNLRVWPHKIVEAGSILSSSLIWGEKWNKVLFNAYGVSGLGNIEITPEFAAKLGCAYGAFVGQGSYVLISRDNSKASRMISRGIVSGLLSAGVKVGDLRCSPIPAVCYEIGNDGEIGAIYVRQSPFNHHLIDIKFFNSTGGNISANQEKSIEQLFFREDFERAGIENVGEIVIPPRAVDYYKSGYLNAINKEIIRKAKKKVVIDYSNSAASIVFPSILGELEVEVVSLNAFLNSSKITKSKEEFASALNQLSDVVSALYADVGFLVDAGAEKLFLVNEQGKVMSDDLAMVTVAYLVMKNNKNENAVIAVPVNASSIIDELAAKFNVKVMRTATNTNAIMTAAGAENVTFVSDGIGGFIFPEFQPSFDAMYAIGKIIEMQSQENLTFGQVNKKISHFEVLHKIVSCSWDKKGKAMRRAIEETKNKKADLIDGVKIYLDNGWVLLIPDSDAPLFHIWAEAKNKSATEGLLEIYADKIRMWQE